MVFVVSVAVGVDFDDKSAAPALPRHSRGRQLPSDRFEPGARFQTGRIIAGAVVTATAPLTGTSVASVLTKWVTVIGAADAVEVRAVEARAVAHAARSRIGGVSCRHYGAQTALRNQA
jgi:hypothetical protein